MHRSMAPLTALRAFEAAARHLSLTRAATELHVTAGALSHQIRGLEELLGVKLFERRVRAPPPAPARAPLFPGPPPRLSPPRAAPARPHPRPPPPGPARAGRAP